MARPPSRTAAPSSRLAGPSATGAGEAGASTTAPGRGCSATKRLHQVLELAGLPVLERRAGRRPGLRDRRDRDAPGLGLVDHLLHVRRGVLAVEHEHLDLPAGDLLLDGGLVGGADVGALADR